MQKGTAIATLFVLLDKKKEKKSPPELPAALYLALSLAVGHRRCIFQSELIHTTGF